MVALGGVRFLMSEVPLYARAIRRQEAGAVMFMVQVYTTNAPNPPA